MWNSHIPKITDGETVQCITVPSISSVSNWSFYLLSATLGDTKNWFIDLLYALLFGILLCFDVVILFPLKSVLKPKMRH